jgi:Zn-dependent protease
MMAWDPQRGDHSYREYPAAAEHIDYAHPDFYRQGPPTPASTSQIYSNYPYEPAQMQPYQGPASIEGYTSDPGAIQRRAAQKEGANAGKRKGLAGLGGGLAALGALLLKFQWLGFLLKFGWAGISALVSIALYAVVFGWAFAVGLVTLLFIHEMGHALVMKLKGIPLGGLVFIPMLGAAVFMRQRPKNARDEAEIGIAGPLAGALASIGCLALAWRDPDQVWAPLAYFGFFINLFNLIPVLPFDGGRVLAAIDRRVWIIGFLGLLAFQIWSWINGDFSPWLLFFVIMAATQFWARRLPDTPETQAYYHVPLLTRILIALLYFGLAAVLMLGMSLARTLIVPYGL